MLDFPAQHAWALKPDKERVSGLTLHARAGLRATWIIPLTAEFSGQMFKGNANKDVPALEKCHAGKRSALIPGLTENCPRPPGWMDAVRAC